MSKKAERITEELEKLKGKISGYQARVRELEKQRTELENMEIIDAVRGSDISLADLAALLKQTAGAAGGGDGGGGDAATSGQPGPMSREAQDIEEENE